jgi:hypothetical protein
LSIRVSTVLQAEKNKAPVAINDHSADQEI